MRPLFAALIFATLAAPAAAQTLPDVAERVGVLERDMRAVKRRVLPRGERELIEPEIVPGAVIAAPVVAGPSPVAVLGERIDAVERQQRQLTATIEEQQLRLRQLSEEFAKFRQDAEFRLGRIEAPAAGPAVPAIDAGGPPAAGVVERPRAEAVVPRAEPAAPTPTSTPATAEDRFQAAFALVQAKDWPRAVPALEAFIAASPKHRRASHARYWLGRSHYSQGDFDRSARIHFDNYKASATGERAQESLYWVGQSLMRLKRQREACQVYDLADRVYAEDMKAELRPQFVTARATAACA